MCWIPSPNHLATPLSIITSQDQLTTNFGQSIPPNLRHKILASTQERGSLSDVHLQVVSDIHTCIQSSIHATIYTCIHAYIPCIHKCIHPCMQASIHPSIHPCSHLSIHPSIHPPIHPSMQSLAKVSETSQLPTRFGKNKTPSKQDRNNHCHPVSFSNLSLQVHGSVSLGPPHMELTSLPTPRNFVTAEPLRRAKGK